MANTTTKKQYPAVQDPFSQEKLKALPTAKASSTPEEMRQICLDFMRAQLSFRWVPSEDFEYTIKSAKRPVKLSTDTVYAGLPYVNLGSGNLYRAMEYYDEETGVLDISKLKENPQIFGNACSGAACIAWARCVSSAKMTYTSGMTQLMGYQNVGPYTYMKELPLFIKAPYTLAEDPERKYDYTSHNIGNEMGRDVMYESFAALKPADGVHSRGHVRMVSQVHVERDENGEIDGEKSYILYMDQVATPYQTEVKEKENGEKEYLYHTDTLQADGTPVYVQGGIDIKVDFKTLFEKHYIPFTFKEFTGEASYAKPVIRMKEIATGENILRTIFTTEHLKEIEIQANYPFSDIFITVTDRDGTLLYEDVYRCPTHHKYALALKDILKLEDLKLFQNGRSTLELKIRLLNGVTKSGWSGFKGTLIPGKIASELQPEDLTLHEKLKAIPIAKEGMAPEQLRKMCVDFMRLQVSFPYKLEEDFEYWVERQDYKVRLKKDEVHAGIPYVNIGGSSLYRWAEHMDPKTGIVNMKEFGRNKRIFGNACSGGCATSWARCITSVRLGWTHEMTQANGVIPVGPYTYRKDIRSFHNPEKYTAKTVCKENGEQVMFESYALLQPGDGLNCPGHIRMATGLSHVVRNPDGTIDGNKSYAVFSDQGMITVDWYHVRQQKNGDYYVVEGCVDVKIPFKKLYDTNYLPFTFKEFLGQAPVKQAYAVPNSNKKCFNADELNEVEFSFNYPLSDAFYKVTDVHGKVMAEGVWRSISFATYKAKLGDMLPREDMKRLEIFEAPYTLNMQFQLYNGELLKGYRGFKVAILPGKGGTSTTIPGKSLVQQLKQIPVAKPGMREYRLRQICLDYMKLQCEFPHLLSENVTYTIGSQKKERHMPAGMVHGGLPYVTCGSGNLYRMAEICDPETGVLDATSECIQNARIFGNACSGGASISWSRVVNSANFSYTFGMCKAQGFLPVGPYKYPEEFKSFRNAEKYNQKSVCKDNGEQVMYESYAAMLPADGVVSTGHVRMNSAYPTVVRDENGFIDGDKSYTLMTEQVCYSTGVGNNIRKHPDGTHYCAQGMVDMKYTFKQLFDTFYIPFTFAELIGTKEVEDGKVEISQEKNLKEASLKSNFPISDVFVTITDAKGEEVYRTVYRAPDFFIKEMPLAKILPWEEMQSVAGEKIHFSCQLYNGEKIEGLSAPWKA